MDFYKPLSFIAYATTLAIILGYLFYKLRGKEKQRETEKATKSLIISKGDIMRLVKIDIPKSKLLKTCQDLFLSVDKALTRQNLYPCELF